MTADRRFPGRSRCSISDEPWGFPTLLLQQGAETVVAPSWQVDDFASFLLITFLFAVLDEDTPLERAEVSAAQWLRKLKAEQIGPHIDLLMDRLHEAGKAGQAATRLVAERVQAQRARLERLDPSQRPVASPLDWAAFQVFGAAPTA
jgi:CHAT domain-containing protein